MMRSQTRYFSKGSIIADSGEDARGLMVITAGQARVHAFKTRIQYNNNNCKMQ